MRRDSIVWWVLRTHRGYRRKLPERFARVPHLQVVRLRSPGAARRWLARF